MRAFKEYETTPEFTESVKLPAGAYEVTIKRAEDSEKALCILFDISEGEYRNYYMNKFSNDKKNYPDNAKYKGVLRLWYPNGSQYDDNYKKRIKTALKRIKESNNLNVDFTKEWDGAALKGAKVGMIFRDQEWSYNGSTGFTAQPYSIITLSDLKEGNFKLPEPKRLSANSAEQAQTNSGFETYTDVPSDEDLPF